MIPMLAKSAGYWVRLTACPVQRKNPGGADPEPLAAQGKTEPTGSRLNAEFKGIVTGPAKTVSRPLL
jgi:hypothetical protein